jgi:hypothetical protein
VADPRSPRFALRRQVDCTVKTQPGQQEEAAMNEATPSPLGNVITIDDERIKNHRTVVRDRDPPRCDFFPKKLEGFYWSALDPYRLGALPIYSAIIA